MGPAATRGGLLGKLVDGEPIRRYPADEMSIRCALLSVSDKTGLVEFARGLKAAGVMLLSTGGTHEELTRAGIEAVSVEQYTGSPEVMAGRVKTLHPRVHGGLLAREGTDEKDLERLGARFIDLVAVNLYPFEQTLQRENATVAALIENIDIGGPSMLRSAAKNHERVGVVCDPADYPQLLEELSSSGELGPETRKRLAAKAFAHTAAYDAAISGWLSSQGEADSHPRNLTLSYEKAYGLRYGENPHQRGAFYRESSAPAGTLAMAESLGFGAKELSFNNLVDADAALEAAREFDAPAAVVVKHASPCGVAVHSSLPEAFVLAREADALSAFGGIVALNREVCDGTAERLVETFLECVVAPSFAPAALSILRQKKNLRLLKTGPFLPADRAARLFKRVSGGLLIQDRDVIDVDEMQKAKLVTDRAPTEAERDALRFAWRACKHVKSNAIVLAHSPAAGALATIGIGGGQTSRVDAVEIACRKAGDRAKGSVLASDAFFPFADSIERAKQAGVVAVLQPGGSKRDQEVIDAVNRAGMSMLLTGRRHFLH